jgi:hypothetical protein
MWFLSGFWRWRCAVQPTGENGATRAPIVVDLQREPGLSSKSIMLQIDSKSQQVSASKMALHPVSTDVFWDLGTRFSIELDYFLTLTFFFRCGVQVPSGIHSRTGSAKERLVDLVGVALMKFISSCE